MIAIVSGIPHCITQADTVTFTVSISGYPPSYYDAEMAICGEVFKAIGIIIDGTFDFVFPSEKTKDFKSGQQTYALRVVEKSTGYVRTVAGGTIHIVPSQFSGNDPLKWQRETLAKCEESIQKLVSGTHKSVNFNGQQFTLQSLKELMDIRDALKGEIQKEEDRNAMQMGIRRSTTIVPRFRRV